MEVYLFRHGKTSGNEEKRYVGETDEGLSLQGKAQLLEMKKERKLYREAKECLEAVYVSPKKRCLETAAIMFPSLEPIQIPELRECNFGIFEYKNYKELNGNPDYQKWIDSGGMIGFPQGEDRAAFQKRCGEGFERAVSHALKMEFKKIALVVHGGTIMAILQQWGIPKRDYFDWQTENGNGFFLTFHAENWLKGERKLKVWGKLTQER